MRHIFMNSPKVIWAFNHWGIREKSCDIYLKRSREQVWKNVRLCSTQLTRFIYLVQYGKVIKKFVCWLSIILLSDQTIFLFFKHNCVSSICFGACHFYRRKYYRRCHKSLVSVLNILLFITSWHSHVNTWTFMNK